MASTQHVTPCRIMCSTPNPQRGQSGAFYDMAMNDRADMERIVLHWTKDPEKSRGLYRTKGNSLEILDGTYPFDPKYEFVYDEKTRSPYYDYECRRPQATPQSIAAELDMDFGGATRRFFDPGVISRGFRECREPDFLCVLRHSHDSWMTAMEVTENKNVDGLIEIWVPDGVHIWVDEMRQVHIPRGRSFAMGIDVSQGLAGGESSYSAIAVFDRTTGEQVAEFRHNKLPPMELAEFANAFGAAWNYALMCAEVTGVGALFQAKIIEKAYPNLWYRPQNRDSINRSDSRKPNYDNKDGGMTILGEMQRAMQTNLVHIRSRRVIQECERYFVDERGRLKHPLVGKGRAGSPEQSHGDCAIACAVGWWAIHEDAGQAVRLMEEEIPYGSFAQRRRDATPRQKSSYGWSPFEDQQPVASW